MGDGRNGVEGCAFALASRSGLVKRGAHWHEGSTVRANSFRPAVLQPYTYKGYTEHLAPSLPLQSLPGREEDWLPTGEYMKDLPRNLPTWGLKRPNQPISQGERHQMLLIAELINSCFATYPLED